MRYDKDDRQSKNIEDHRGRRPRGFGFPGRGGRGIQIPIGGRGGFSLTTLIIIGVVMMFLGINPLDLLRGGIGPGGGGGYQEVPQLPRADQGPSTRRSPVDIPGLPGGSQSGQPKSNDEKKVFIAQVLADTEDVWTNVFKSFGRTYEPPTLRLFTGATQTGCGFGQAAMGPFYCPLDQKIYIDLSFYDQLARRFNAPGDFAQAYVIAHEVGHHVQKLLGIADKVQSLKRTMSKREANALQVRMELQADCLSGVWARLNDQMKDRLEDGDIEEGLNAASQIGDDMIQKRTQGHVVPDAFTHGSAKQRVRWFKTGFRGAKMQVCDTFRTENL